MEYVGLLFEVLFFALGVYVYLFARGKFSAADPTTRKRMDDFRAKNSWWLRLAGLAIMAVMLLNIALHVQQLLQ